ALHLLLRFVSLRLPLSPLFPYTTLFRSGSSPRRVAMTNAALRTIFPIAGWGEERARAVEITGGTDPIFPTSFRIAETSAAALARSEEHTSELQSRVDLVCRLLLEKKKRT